MLQYSISNIIPIIIMICIAIGAIALAYIFKLVEKKSLLSSVDASVNDKDFISKAIDNKKRKLNADLSGVSWKNYIIIMIVAIISFGLLGFVLLENKPLCIIFALFGVLMPELVVKIKHQNKQSNFEKKYARALKTFGSSLRAGMSIQQAVEDVVNNNFLDEEIKRGFRQIATDIKVGISIEDAFRRFAKDSKSKDAEDVATAISMQSKVGGSDASAIAQIVQNINDRIMTKSEIKTMFSSTSILVLVMDVLPFLLGIVMFMFLPNLMEPYLTDPQLTIVLLFMTLITIIGSVVIHKMEKKAKGE